MSPLSQGTGRSRGERGALRLVAFLVYMGRLSLYTWKQLVKDKCLTSASALAFATLAAVIPVATVAFTVYRASAGLGGFEDYVKKRVFEWMLGTASMTQRENPPPVPQPGRQQESPPVQPEQPEEEGKPVSLEVAAQKYSESVAKWVTLLSDQLRGYTANIISVTALIVMSVFLLNTVEGAFNDVWHTTLKRSFLYKFVVFWAVITLGPVFIGASFYISWSLDQYLKMMPGLNALSRLFLAALPLTLSVAVFFAMYYFLPNAKVRWTSALAGAVVAAILWHLAKRGMYLYAVRVVPYSKIYGSLGLALIFMLWLFITWLIVLFGVEVSYTSQNLHALRYLEQRKKIHFPPLSEGLALRVVLMAAKALLEGRGPLSVLGMSRELLVAEEEIRPIADRLAVTRLLTVVNAPGGPFGHDVQYVLAKSPETLSVRETLQSVKEDMDWALSGSTNDEQRELSELLRQVDASSAEVLKGLTIADLLKQLVSE